MARPPHVALIVETSSIYGQRILEGVTQYIRTHRPWSVFLDQRDLFADPPRWLSKWRGDGIICRSTTRQAARALVRRRTPVVDLSDIDHEIGVPRIESDHHRIGRLAADHLLQRGFRHFGYCGFFDHTWAVKRREGFADTLREAGYDCSVHESTWGAPSGEAWETEQRRIVRWLSSLPQPAGVMACNDLRGQHVLDACARAGIAVPESIAVIGCDNDALLCNLCDPPLSSVMPNPARVGYEAAKLLDVLMTGKKPSIVHQLIEPIDVVTRQSTDVLAIDDTLVAEAMRYIRQHACDGATVETLLDQLGVSRTTLERRFRKHLGRSPHAEFRNVQVKRVKQLLTETDLPLHRIADLAGFKHAEYMSVMFKRETGTTPGKFRKQIAE